MAAVLTLVACGGGSDTVVTPLPSALTVLAPTSIQPLGAAISFSSNAATLGSALTHSWDFGDGSSSVAASPSHGYASPGQYTVRLTVNNEAGATSSTIFAVTVADLAIVKGKACSRADDAGWCRQRPQPQGNLILDYVFVDDRYGWAVGEAGTLLATTDGGATWQPQAAGTDLQLRKAAFVNRLVGWVASNNGALLKTADGGATWRSVSFGRNEFVTSLGAADGLMAWVTTNAPAAYVTIDGGASWKSIVHPTDRFGKLVLTSASDIWSMPFSGSPIALSHSRDGGATWSEVNLPAIEPGLSRSLADLQFIDTTQGLVVAYESGVVTATQESVTRQVAWHTADGGNSWHALAPTSAGGNFSIDLRLAAANAIFVTPYGAAPVGRSLDGGATWEALPMPPLQSYFRSFTAFSAQRLIVTDGASNVFLSTDAGAHWGERGAGDDFVASANSVWFFDARNGLAIGSDGSSVRTSDGGQTWITTPPPSFQSWRRAQFSAGGSVGWAISDGGTILRSTDKGQAWLSPTPQTSVSMFSVSDFHFIDEQRGWAVSPFSFAQQGSIFRTTNGGVSWQVVPGTATLDGYLSLRFADATHGVAVGPPGIAMLSSDGGATWSPRPTNIDRGMRRVTFADASTAVAVGEGGAIVRSVDRGQTWTKVPSPTTNALNDVRFFSATFGHAVGDLGTLLVTENGGQTWTPQDLRTNLNLRAVYFADTLTGWVSGDNGSIFVTATGGR